MSPKDTKIKVAFATLGCKLNFAETSGLKMSLPEDVCELVPFTSVADVYVVNTCTVTEAADKKGRNLISRAVRLNRNAKIIVVGCQSQVNADKVSELEGVTLVLGNQEKFSLAEYIHKFRSNNPDEVIHVTERNKMNQFNTAVSQNDRTRCFIKIQDGCDYFCTYCIVPHARGRSRNAPVEDVLTQIRDARERGIVEVILTGVNTGDFGKTTGESLTDLMQAIMEKTDVPRLRLSSVEPDLLTNELIALYGAYHRLMPHIHLPLQSGSNDVLKLMKRRYNAEDFEDRVTRIIEAIPNAFIGVDVICGFPGETAQMFDETKAFLEKLPVSALHVFPYSARPGTPAASLENQVHPSEKERRTHELLALSDEKKLAFYLRFAGQKHKVLVEKISADGMAEGFTENYIPVIFPASKNIKKNTIIDVVISAEVFNGKVKGTQSHDES